MRWSFGFLVLGLLGCSSVEGDLFTPASSMIPEYDRDLWQHWTDEDGDCQDTRQEILIRDSQVPVGFADAKQCRVQTGRWVCPYTGQVITNPSSVDIDHIVALQDAHVSGAWAWSDFDRRIFANDITHLVATSQNGNRSKGAKGPDEWLPPIEGARCGYLEVWTNIKVTSKLGFSEGERAVLGYMTKICEKGQVPHLPQ